VRTQRKTYYQRQEPVLIRENPVVRKADLTTSLEKLTLEGDPIITRQTETRRELPQYRQEKSEVYEREIVHERPIIHEKDIYYVEKPIYIEKPEILEQPVLQSGGSQVVKEELVRREMLAEDLTIPSEALRHTDRVVMKEPAVFMRERPEIFEREVLVEKPIMYEQPVIYTEKQEIHEVSEFVEKRGKRVEQPIVERSDLVVTRSDDPNLTKEQRGSLDSQRGDQRGDQRWTTTQGIQQKSTYDVA